MNKKIVTFLSLLFLLLAQSAFSENLSSQPPRWTVSSEALFFDRVGTDKWTLVERVPGATYFNNIKDTPGTSILDSADLNQGFSPGFRVGATYHIDSNNDLSLSFFRIAEWDSTKSVGPDNPLDWLVMRAPGAFIQTQDFTFQSMTWDYSTQLYNGEISLQKKISNRINLLAGFRWLQLNENLQGTIPPRDNIWPLWKLYSKADISYVEWYETQPGIPAPDFPPFWNTSTTNNLYGLQIGADGKLFERGRFCFDGVIKVGGYLNHASQSTGVSLQKTVYTVGASTDQPAFVGEAGLQCKYKLTRALTLKIGYEALWLNGVALAPGQIKKSYTIAPNIEQSQGINSDSNVLFHGATVGFEFSF